MTSLVLLLCFLHISQYFYAFNGCLQKQHEKKCLVVQNYTYQGEGSHNLSQLRKAKTLYVSSVANDNSIIWLFVVVQIVCSDVHILLLRA